MAKMNPFGGSGGVSTLDNLVEGGDLVFDAVGVFTDRPSLLLYPFVGLVSSLCLGIAGIIVLGTIAVTLGAAAGIPVLVLLLLAVGAGTYLLIAFANTLFLAALVNEVYDYHHGDPLSIREGVRAAVDNWWPLLLWAGLNWTVGMIIRRRSSEGRTSRRLFGEVIRTGWTGATFFVIPVILFEDARGRDMLQTSAGHFRESWEQILAAVLGLRLLGWIIGGFGAALGSVFFLGELAIIAAPIFVFFASLGFVITTTLQGVMKATVYEHLTSEDQRVEDVVPEERSVDAGAGTRP